MQRLAGDFKRQFNRVLRELHDLSLHPSRDGQSQAVLSDVELPGGLIANGSVGLVFRLRFGPG